MKQGYLSSKLRKIKCSKIIEDNHTGSGIHAFSAIIIIVQKITTKHDSSTILIIVFVLYNRLPQRPTKIGIKIEGRRITGVELKEISTQKLKKNSLLCVPVATLNIPECNIKGTNLFIHRGGTCQTKLQKINPQNVNKNQFHL